MWVENKLAQRRLGDVIKTDATTTSKGDFLITHAPFETLYLNGKTAITEDQLLNEYLLASDKRDRHQFIMIQGGNGTGKTHLIRWLKEKYEASTDRNEEAVLLISRAHNNLQDAMTQLLNSNIFPSEVKERTLKLLENARGNKSVADFKKLINFMFHLEIQNDPSTEFFDKRTKAWLSSFIMNQFVLDTFLMRDGGPLDRIRAKIETTDSAQVVDGDAPVFLPEDFDISFSQINSGLKRMDNHAETGAIRMAEEFSRTGTGRAVREKVASYLNTKVSSVIRSSMDLKSIDFQHIFEELRKDLKKKGMSLTLFLEDINAFTGIDEALIEALLVDHTAEGNQDCCRLTSVVGSTIWFYENKLNSSIRERIAFNVYLREGSVISEGHLDAFAARYINAINLPEESVSQWYANGGKEDEIPLAPSNYPFSEVLIQGKPYSIFPFTANALNRLYKTLEIRDENNSSRTPRVVLNQIIQQILLQWYKKGPALFSSENNFVNAAFSIPRWNDDTYELSNRALAEDYITERSILLRIWGDGTTNHVGDTIGGVSKEIFDAFGIPFPEGESEVHPPKPEPEVTAPVPQQPPINTHDKKLRELTNEINDWASNETVFLRSHSDLRDDLVRFIMNNTSWTEMGVPFKLAEACIQRRFIIIEGQSAAAQPEHVFILKRGDETRFLLLALARWRYAGGNSWEFENGLDYYTIAISWLEKHMEELCDFVVRTKNSCTAADLAELGVVAQYCVKLFSDGFDDNQETKEAMISLFKKAPVFEQNATQPSIWNTVALEIQKYIELVQLSLSFYRKAVGGRRPEDANYVFVDAYELLAVVDRMKARNWALDAYSILPEDDNGLRTQFSKVIAIVQSQIKFVLREGRNEASIYKNFFMKQISQDLGFEDINKTLQTMKDFLSYLNQKNESYESSLISPLNNAELATKTHKALGTISEILNCSDETHLLSLLSENPFDEINSIYQLFSRFDVLLEDKMRKFRSGINQTLLNELDVQLQKAKDEMKVMQTQYEQLKKV